MAKKPRKLIPVSLFWCHKSALRTLNCLDQVVCQFAPESVQQMKSMVRKPSAKHMVGNAGKAISYLRHEYISWCDYQESIPRFASTQPASIQLLGIVAPSAHDLLDRLVRKVLNRAWRKITPWSPEETRTPEENLWPDAQLLADADLDQMADALLIYTKDREEEGPIGAESIKRIEAALKEEYARLVERLPLSES